MELEVAKEFEAAELRERLREGSRKARPFGQRDDEGFPFRPEGAIDFDLRGNAKVEDISDSKIIGIDQFT